MRKGTFFFFFGGFFCLLLLGCVHRSLPHSSSDAAIPSEFCNDPSHQPSPLCQDTQGKTPGLLAKSSFAYLMVTVEGQPLLNSRNSQIDWSDPQSWKTGWSFLFPDVSKIDEFAIDFDLQKAEGSQKIDYWVECYDQKGNRVSRLAHGTEKGRVELIVGGHWTSGISDIHLEDIEKIVTVAYYGKSLSGDDLSTTSYYVVLPPIQIGHSALV